MISENGFWTVENPVDFYDDFGMLEGLRFFLKKNNIKNLVDFGCGNGFYVSELIKEGISCIAYDGNPNTSLITNGLAQTLDLSNRFDLGRKFDCVLSIEVGEHIPEEFENNYIVNLTRHSKKFIILSWAVIGQPGTGHVNCRDNDYIISRMSQKDFKYLEEESLLLRNNCDLFWLKNTVMIFEKNTEKESFVISVKKEDYKNDKRRKNVLQNIIPTISKIMNVSIFDAVTPDDIELKDNLVIYKDQIFQRGIDKNINETTTLKNCSLTIGHYNLFQYSVSHNKKLLIFEDDAVVNHLDIEDFKKDLEEFNKVDEPAILYLQSECPWGNNPYLQINGRYIRNIPSSFLSKVQNSNLLKLNKDWFDISGTTCYYINPSASSIMIKSIQDSGLINIDQVTQLCLKLDRINFYLPINYEKVIYLL